MFEVLKSLYRFATSLFSKVCENQTFCIRPTLVKDVKDNNYDTGRKIKYE